MPDQTAQVSTTPALSQLLQQAMQEISPTTQQAVLAHPDTPGVIDRIKTALGMGQGSAMTTAEQAAYKDATGQADVGGDSGNSAETAARAGAVSDIAGAVAKSASTPTTSKPSFEDAMKGVGQLITTLLMHGHNAASQEMTTKSNTGSTK